MLLPCGICWNMCILLKNPKKVYRVFKNEGEFIASIPNADSVERKLFGGW